MVEAINRSGHVMGYPDGGGICRERRQYPCIWSDFCLTPYEKVAAFDDLMCTLNDSTAKLAHDGYEDKTRPDMGMGECDRSFAVVADCRGRGV
ncbi:hypothetical protein TPL01_25860 [Sulfuriferula plumbiphila]|uniref:Uncharacterized protein n=1 Tax=Sulfuriferula plumbiphila TaxID=171865 RepID=A0A512LAD2_9PROT|nr:hypothetical protein [Sulfuriferula plumbiphila]BBP04985.1 hypothetical protein SFPGR_24070 [Sulfuriferula plumbiphila]GEP31448.1 hypothetical protein TPL01_25860 [Sulfuriferula plumbiphila]